MTDPFVVGEAVRDALEAGRPVVAMETSVLAHGLPFPRNLDAAAAMTAAVRAGGAEPAWVSIEGGAVVVGAGGDTVEALCWPEAPKRKVARRDIAAAVAARVLGGTTVSATLWAAARAGIEVTATGGIGGVHPGSRDVSADLVELSRTPGTLVCSGPKSIVDPVATLERLEELGVGVLGYRCRTLPLFLVRETDLPLEHVVSTPGEAAAASRARRDLAMGSTLLVCNPIPESHAMDPEVLGPAVEACLARARREGIAGKDLTPFLLSCLSDRTGGASMNANLALLEANAALAGEIASELS